MRQRGAQQGAAGNAPIRPDPPEWLSEDEADIWKETVDSCPADWFPPETRQILAMYCGHVTRYRYYAAQLAAAHAEAAQLDEKTGKPKGLDTFLVKDLQTFAVKESQAAATLATRMRITQQSSYDKTKSRSGKGAKANIWDVE